MKCPKCGREMTCTDDVNEINVRLDFLNCECGGTATVEMDNNSKPIRSTYEYPNFKIMFDKLEVPNFINVKMFFEHSGAIDLVMKCEWIIESNQCKQITSPCELDKIGEINKELVGLLKLFKKKVRSEDLKGIELEIYLTDGDIDHIIFTRIPKLISERIDIKS